MISRKNHIQCASYRGSHSMLQRSFSSDGAWQALPAAPPVGSQLVIPWLGSRVPLMGGRVLGTWGLPRQRQGLAVGVVRSIIKGVGVGS